MNEDIRQLARKLLAAVRDDWVERRRISTETVGLVIVLVGLIEAQAIKL